MKILFILFAGGGLGTVSRYLLSRWMNGLINTFPYGTFLVNIIGCFLVGFFVFAISKSSPDSLLWKSFLVTGFCGGFTTFSSFAFENVELINNHQILTFLLYTLGSIAIGFLATYMGISVARNI